VSIDSRGYKIQHSKYELFVVPVRISQGLNFVSKSGGTKFRFRSEVWGLDRLNAEGWGAGRDVSPPSAQKKIITLDW